MNKKLRISKKVKGNLNTISGCSWSSSGGRCRLGSGYTNPFSVGVMKNAQNTKQN